MLATFLFSARWKEDGHKDPGLDSTLHKCTVSYTACIGSIRIRGRALVHPTSDVAMVVVNGRCRVSTNKVSTDLPVCGIQSFGMLGSLFFREEILTFAATPTVRSARRSLIE